MHELSIAQSVVEMLTERAAGRRVARVRIEIGKLSAIVPDAIRFCFDVCSEGTVVEGADLEINEVEGRGRCRACARELLLVQPYGECACGSREIELIAGHRMLVKEMEVA